MESHLGSLFFHFGFQGYAILFRAEEERGSASIGSQISVLTSSTSNYHKWSLTICDGCFDTLNSSKM